MPAVSIFHRIDAEISREHFDDIKEALIKWKQIIDSHKGWPIIISQAWTKRMVHAYGVTLIHDNRTEYPTELYSLELWDRTLWLKDNL